MLRRKSGEPSPVQREPASFSCPFASQLLWIIFQVMDGLCGLSQFENTFAWPSFILECREIHLFDCMIVFFFLISETFKANHTIIYFVDSREFFLSYNSVVSFPVRSPSQQLPDVYVVMKYCNHPTQCRMAAYLKA